MYKAVETESGCWIAVKTELTQDELDKAYAEVHLKRGNLELVDNIQHWNAAEAQERADELNKEREND